LALCVADLRRPSSAVAKAGKKGKAAAAEPAEETEESAKQRAELELMIEEGEVGHPPASSTALFASLPAERRRLFFQDDRKGYSLTQLVKQQKEATGGKKKKKGKKGKQVCSLFVSRCSS
jgi:hypothetical protein